MLLRALLLTFCGFNGSSCEGRLGLDLVWAAGRDEAAWKCLCAQVSAPADRCLIVPKRHSQGEGKDRSELPERFSNRTCICRFRLSVLCDKCNLISRSCAAAVLEILFCLFTRPPHPCSSGHDSPFCGALVQLAWKCLCAQVSAPADRCLIVPKRHSQGEGKDRSELPERFSNRTCICQGSGFRFEVTPDPR